MLTHILAVTGAVFLSISAFFGFSSHPVPATSVEATTAATKTVQPAASADWIAISNSNYRGSFYSKSQNNAVSYILGESGLPTDSHTLSGIDFPTFVVSAKLENIAKDKNNVYFDGTLIAGADPATFTVVAGGYGDGSWAYSKDKNNVYLNQHIVTGADPETFQASAESNWSTYDAQDKSHKYLYGKVVE